MSKTVFLHFKWCKDTAFVLSIQIFDCYTFCYTLLIFDISQQVTPFLFIPIFSCFPKFTIIFKAYIRLALPFLSSFLPVLLKFGQ